MLIHIDPAQHETTLDESQLPERTQLIESLKACWENLIDKDSIASIDLHYLGGAIEVDLVLDVDNLSETTARDLESAIEAEPHITNCLLYTSDAADE